MNAIPFEKLNKKSYNAKDQEVIDSWQNRAIVLAEDIDFINHATTKRLVEVVKEQVEIIENILKNDENISEMERKSLFKEKKTHLFYLNLFTRDGSQELEQIAKQVNEEIN